MSSRENHQTDASHHAIAIARWDDEGGASNSARSNTGARASDDLGSDSTAQASADLKIGQARGNAKKNSGMSRSGRHHAMGRSSDQNSTGTLQKRHFSRRLRADGPRKGTDRAIF